MRARDFVQRNMREDKTVNIPITITIPSDEKAPVVVQQNNVAANDDQPTVDTPKDAMLTKAEPVIQEPEVQDNLPDEADGDPDTNKMIPPLQQELELEKSDAGKDSEVIDQLTQDEDEYADDDEHKTPLAYK